MDDAGVIARATRSKNLAEYTPLRERDEALRGVVQCLRAIARRRRPQSLPTLVEVLESLRLMRRVGWLRTWKKSAGFTLARTVGFRGLNKLRAIRTVFHRSRSTTRQN